MKFQSLLLAVVSAFSVSAFSAPDYVPGDGGLDYTCHMTDSNAMPYNIFHLQLLYDQNSPRKGFELISDKNLKSGNGDVVYKVTVDQYPHRMAPVPPVTSVIPGCETAIAIIDQPTPTTFTSYFECAGDGDAGFGTITMDTTAFVTTGKIHFPEGQSTLPFPIPDNTEYDVVCE